MTLNLDQARRLHDRDPNNPARCAICHHTDGDNWPCATALALGATGRTEWTDTPAGRCNATYAHAADRCRLYNGHDGEHHWADETPPEPLCTCGHHRGTHKQDALCRNCDCDTYQEDTPSPDCAMSHPHTGHCTTPNDPCGDPNGKYPQQPCVLRHEHWDQHVDRDGNRWEQEPAQ